MKPLQGISVMQPFSTFLSAKGNTARPERLVRRLCGQITENEATHKWSTLDEDVVEAEKTQRMAKKHLCAGTCLLHINVVGSVTIKTRKNDNISYYYYRYYYKYYFYKYNNYYNYFHYYYYYSYYNYYYISCSVRTGSSTTSPRLINTISSTTFLLV